MSTSRRLGYRLIVRQLARFAVVASLAVIASGCRSKAPPPTPSPPPAIQPPASEPRIDDIPADAPPAIRGHLIKLREMRDLGQITDGDYESRKASLLRQ